eukprot:6475401-Amphidinium_carterae.1
MEFWFLAQTPEFLKQSFSQAFPKATFYQATCMQEAFCCCLALERIQALGQQESLSDSSAPSYCTHGKAFVESQGGGIDKRSHAAETRAEGRDHASADQTCGRMSCAPEGSHVGVLARARHYS